MMRPTAAPRCFPFPGHRTVAEVEAPSIRAAELAERQRMQTYAADTRAAEQRRQMPVSAFCHQCWQRVHRTQAEACRRAHCEFQAAKSVHHGALV